MKKYVVSVLILIALVGLVPVRAVACYVDDSTVAEIKEDILALVNAERAAAGIAELLPMEALDGLADIRASEAAASFCHRRADGSKYHTVLEAGSWRATGENLAKGYKITKYIVSAWMDSPGHRTNILDPDFEYVGVGYFVREDGRPYYSLLFFTPKTQTVSLP